MISSIIFSMGPVYARLSGAGTRGVAKFMAVSILAAVLTQYPVGRLSDRIDRRTVIAGVCMLATLVAGSIVVFSPLPRALFLLLTALFSGSALTLYSLAVSHVNDKLEPAQMVAASSGLLRINGMAAALGPVLGGSLCRLRPACLLRDARLPDRLAHAVRPVAQEPPPPRAAWLKGPFINTQQIVTCAGLDASAERLLRADRGAAAARSSP